MFASCKHATLRASQEAADALEVAALESELRPAKLREERRCPPARPEYTVSGGVEGKGGAVQCSVTMHGVTASLLLPHIPTTAACVPGQSLIKAGLVTGKANISQWGWDPHLALALSSIVCAARRAASSNLPSEKM